LSGGRELDIREAKLEGWCTARISIYSNSLAWRIRVPFAKALESGETGHILQRPEVLFRRLQALLVSVVVERMIVVEVITGQVGGSCQGVGELLECAEARIRD
jgi:hypothetical protein